MRKLINQLKLLCNMRVYFDNQVLVGFLHNKRGERIITYCPERDKFFEDNICWINKLK